MSETNRAYDVFISYSHADEDWVFGWLVPLLKKSGLSVCTDRETFDIGVPALVNMENAVEQSRKTLLVITPNWIKSEWTKFESLLIQTGDPSGIRQRTLPLLLKECSLPKRLGILTYADFTSDAYSESEFEKLLDALRDRRRLPEPVSGTGEAITQPLPAQAVSLPPVTVRSYAPRIPFVLPQLDVSTFTGRSDELTLLEELLLKRQGSKVCSIIGLAGGGGIGKSALACHFATLHKDSFPDGVIGLRVDGKDVDTVAREFARYYGEEFDPEDDRTANVIMQEVFGHRRALLIFDNAEDVAIQALRPGGNRCAVIVTTRDRQLPLLLDIPPEGTIDLSPLTDEDSLRLLESHLGRERLLVESSAPVEIIKLVGNLPLALQIVGATLRMQEWRSLADYAASLSGERERLAKLKIRGAAYLDVRASFLLSLKLLEEHEADFFASLSVCAQDGFSVQAAMAASDCDESTTHEYLSSLYRLSLLNQSQAGSGRFVFHPLIRLFAGELAEDRGLKEIAAERHAHFFIQFAKSTDIDEHASAAALISELDDILLAAQWLLSQEKADYSFIIRLSPFLQRYGHWPQAVTLMSGFLSQAERNEDWNAIAQLHIQQAKYLSLQGNLTKAEAALDPLDEIISRIEPQEIRERTEAMWLNTLGGVLQRQGKFYEAVEALKRSCSISERLDDERGLAMALNSLGGVLQRQGKFDEAVEVFRQSYGISAKLNDQVSLAMVLTSLGGVLQRQGKFDEAVEAFQQGCAVAERIGDERSLAMRLNSLGGVLQRQGKFDEAVDAIRRSYDISEKLNDERSLAMVLNSLGGVLEQQGHFNEAMEAFQRSYGISERLNDEHSLAVVLNSLGGGLQRQGKFNEAVDAIRRSYDISEKLNDERSLAMVLNSLGGVLQRQGKFDEAVEAFQRSYGISERLNDERSLAVVLNSLGGVLQRQGKFNEAVEAFQRSYDIFKELNDERNLAVVLNSLGGVLQRQGRLGEAAEAFQRSYVIAEQLGDQRGLAMILVSLGGVLWRLDQFDEAVNAYQRSAEFERRLGNKRGLAMVLSGLGRVQHKQGRFDEAVKTLQGSYDLEHELKNPRGEAIVLTSMGQVLQDKSDFDGALNAFRRSAEISEQLGDRRGQAMVFTAIGKALVAQGKTAEAILEFQKGFEIDEGLSNSRGLGIVTPLLIRALVKSGRRDEALTYCRRALDVAPENKKLLASQAYLSAPETAKARAVFMKGTVKRIIKHARGYLFGFIALDEGEPDVYFREGYIDNHALSGMREGIRVEVEVERAAGGLRARSARIIELEESKTD